MNMKEKLRSLKEGEFGEFARSLFEDKALLSGTIAELTASDDMADYLYIADLLSYASVDGTDEGNIYTVEPSVGKRYLDLYLNLARMQRIPERYFIRVMLAAQYAKAGTALNSWDEAVDKYIEERAKTDFDGIAELIDTFDKKFAKYGVLIKVNRRRAVLRLLNMALFVKKIDKTAVRDVLKSHPELADDLFKLYGEALSRERASITRLLLLYKNEPTVAEFLDTVVAADKSKTVQSVLLGAKRGAGKNAAAYFEKLMATGEPITFGYLKSLVKENGKTKAKRSPKSYAAVADRILFCYYGEFDEACVFAYNDGKFIDINGNRLKLSDEKSVYVLHPLDIPPDLKDSLSGNIDQPFLQLSRPVFMPQGETYVSSRLNGTMVTQNYFSEAAKTLKFVMTTSRDGSEEFAVHIVGEYSAAVECGFNGVDGSVVCNGIRFYRARDLVKLNKKIYISSARSISAEELPIKSYSELMYGCYRLFDSVEA